MQGRADDDRWATKGRAVRLLIAHWQGVLDDHGRRSRGAAAGGPDTRACAAGMRLDEVDQASTRGVGACGLPNRKIARRTQALERDARPKTGM